MNKVWNLANRLARLQMTFAGIAVLAILLIISLDVSMRFLRGSSISSTIEIVSFYCMVPIAFLPIMSLEMSSAHVETDLFYRHFSIRMKKFAAIVAGTLTVGIYGLLLYVTFGQAVKATETGERAMGVALMPVWPIRWVLPVVFVCGMVAAILVTYRRISGDLESTPELVG